MKVAFTDKMLAIVNSRGRLLTLKMSEISPNEVSKEAHRTVPVLIYKNGSKFYKSEISRTFKLNHVDHMCCACGRASAASDENHGCKKVRDLWDYKRIDKYPFVTEGIQTFNTKEDFFLVIKCEHQCHYPTGKRKSAEELDASKLCLAQFLWADAKTLEDVQKILASRRKGY